MKDIDKILKTLVERKSSFKSLIKIKTSIFSFVEKFWPGAKSGAFLTTRCELSASLKRPKLVKPKTNLVFKRPFNCRDFRISEADFLFDAIYSAFWWSNFNCVFSFRELFLKRSDWSDNRCQILFHFLTPTKFNLVYLCL